jgi:hypothetical protein
MSSYDGNEGIDLSKYPKAATLVETCKQFFSEVQDLYVLSSKIPSHLTI